MGPTNILSNRYRDFALGIKWLEREAKYFHTVPKLGSVGYFQCPIRVYGAVLNYACGEIYLQCDTITITKSWNIIWEELVACVVEPRNMYSPTLVFLEYVRGRDQMVITNPDAKIILKRSHVFTIGPV